MFWRAACSFSKSSGPFGACKPFIIIKGLRKCSFSKGGGSHCSFQVFYKRSNSEEISVIYLQDFLKFWQKNIGLDTRDWINKCRKIFLCQLKHGSKLNYNIEISSPHLPETWWLHRWRTRPLKKLSFMLTLKKWLTSLSILHRWGGITSLVVTFYSK